MKKSIQVGRVYGISININYTWLIIFGLVVWTLTVGYFPYVTPNLPLSTYLIMAVISAALLFLSLLAHELAHSVVALRNNLPIRGITLFIFGGVAHMEKEPDDPKTEFKMAVAGPVCSLVISFIFWVTTQVLFTLKAPMPVIAVTSYLYILNSIVAVFNLVPGFPLDGGRILRSLLWSHYKEIKKATRIASNFGKAFAYILMAYGILNLFTSSLLTGIWFMFIGMFLFEAAETSYQQVAIQKALHGIHVNDIMTRSVVTVDAKTTLDYLIDEYFLKYRFTSFPVIANEMLVGLLTLHNVRDIPKDKWPQTTAEEAMVKLNSAIIISPETEITYALSKMAASGIGRLLVVEDHSLIGILSQRDVMRLFEVREDLER